MTNVELLVENVKRSKADIDEVYIKGYEDGKAEGGGFDADAYFEQKFNEITKNGTITNYSNTFFGKYTDDVTFKPTHDMQPTNVSSMFNSSMITNLLQILKDRNVVLDTSKCTSFIQFVQNATITHLPCISLESLTATTPMGNLFTYARQLIYIEKIICHRDIVWTASAFNGCESLVTIGEFEGEIGTSFVINACKNLDSATAKRIIMALVNYSGTENEFVNKVIFHSDVWTRLDAEGNTAPDGTTWKEYVDNIGWNR